MQYSVIIIQSIPRKYNKLQILYENLVFLTYILSYIILKYYAAVFYNKYITRASVQPVFVSMHIIIYYDEISRDAIGHYPAEIARALRTISKRRRLWRRRSHLVSAGGLGGKAGTTLTRGRADA